MPVAAGQPAVKRVAGSVVAVLVAGCLGRMARPLGMGRAACARPKQRAERLRAGTAG